MEIPAIENTHVYVDPTDPAAWMIVVRSTDDAPTRLSCSSSSGDTHEWIRDVERSIDLRRSLLAARTPEGSP
jgi:hypothetical protein